MVEIIGIQAGTNADLEVVESLTIRPSVGQGKVCPKVNVLGDRDHSKKKPSVL